MAFPSAAGYTNLPNGNFSPTIFSKKAQLAFRKTAVVPAISNSEYFGEISAFGDAVRIIKEPEITINDYTRGTQIVTQSLDDEELTLTIDQAKYFNFAVDDIEAKHAHLNWLDMASDRAGYKLRDTFDSNVLTYTSTQVPAGQTLGTNAAPQKVGFGAGAMTPLAVMNRLKRLLTQNLVPLEDRWIVVDPVFVEMLEAEESKLVNRDYDGSADTLRNGKVTAGKIRGFSVHESMNLPTVGTGPESTSGSNYGWILAGHKSALATAEQIDKTEKYRPQNTFADAVKGLHLFGRKVLRQESLVAVRWQM